MSSSSREASIALSSHCCPAVNAMWNKGFQLSRARPSSIHTGHLIVSVKSKEPFSIASMEARLIFLRICAKAWRASEYKKHSHDSFLRLRRMDRMIERLVSVSLICVLRIPEMILGQKVLNFSTNELLGSHRNVHAVDRIWPALRMPWSAGFFCKFKSASSRAIVGMHSSMIRNIAASVMLAVIGNERLHISIITVVKSDLPQLL